MPNWDAFTIVGGRGVYEKRVSLSSRGIITLNQPSFDALGGPERVELFYDHEDELIGLKPSTPEIKHSVKIRKQGDNKSYLINARPFCYHFKISTSQTIRFKDITMSNGVMVLDINTASHVEPTRTARDSSDKLQGNRQDEVDE